MRANRVTVQLSVRSARTQGVRARDGRHRSHIARHRWGRFKAARSSRTATAERAKDVSLIDAFVNEGRQELCVYAGGEGSERGQLV